MKSGSGDGRELLWQHGLMISDSAEIYLSYIRDGLTNKGGRQVRIHRPRLTCWHTLRTAYLCLALLSSLDPLALRLQNPRLGRLTDESRRPTGAGAAELVAESDKLWEDDWDDDDTGEEFSTQLRLVVLPHPTFTYRLRSHLPLSAEPGKTR